VLATVCAILVCRPAMVAAQSDRALEVGVQIVSATWQKLDAADFGVGGRVAWRAVPMLGVEAELNLFPATFPEAPAFSRRRLEALFGATLGPSIRRVRPFARVRAGFLDVAKAPQPFACILIYPPPLSCTLAGGRTMAALDLGGGLDVTVTPRTFVRVDAGDRMVRYPGPVRDAGVMRSSGFFAHDFRVAAGAGIRF
jgi:hypothetical protein